MSEIVLRVAGPALLAVVEVEAPIRLTAIATSESDQARLAAWLAEPERAHAVTAMLHARERSGGAGRQARWTRELREEGGGIADAVGQLLRELFDARAELVRERERPARRPARRRSLRRPLAWARVGRLR